MEGTEKKTKSADQIFFATLLLLVLGAVCATFVRYVVLKDYQVMARTFCDPQTENCFASTCDPGADSSCPTDENARTTYYKLISKNAATIAQCEATVEKLGCIAELRCTPSEASCSYIFCNPATVPEGETCTK